MLGALRSLHGGLPACGEIAQINSREAARLCQWSAPSGVLAEYPTEPRIRRELLIAVTEGDLATEASLVDECLKSYFGEECPMGLLPKPTTARPIEFWLDLPSTPGWKGFAHAQDEVCIIIDDSTALVREDRSGND